VLAGTDLVQAAGDGEPGFADGYHVPLRQFPRRFSGVAGPGRLAAPADADGLEGLKRAAGQSTVLTGQGLTRIPQTLRESGIPALFMNNGAGVAYLTQSCRA
jgi:hypothetical protein